MALKYHPDKNKEAGAEAKFKVGSFRFSIMLVTGFCESLGENSA